MPETPDFYNMKHLLFCITALLLHTITMAQSNDSLPPYREFPALPGFSMIQAPDSTWFNPTELKKKKAVVLIFFSPDCEHCQHETRELIKHIDLFKKVQIVMYSPLEYKYVKKFYDEYGLGQYKQFIVGSDTRYKLGNFYKAHTYPSIFVYDKNKKFVEAFEGSIPVEKIANSL